jgi:hypothetical protein
MADGDMGYPECPTSGDKISLGSARGSPNKE